MNEKINIAFDRTGTLNINDLHPFQGELKSLSKKSYESLKKEILKTGFAFPIHVWENPEDKLVYVVGGHQRLRTLKQMQMDGIDVPLIPVNYIKADSVKEAKRRVLQDVAQYGQVERTGLYEFMHEAEIDFADLSDSFVIPEVELNMEDFETEFFKESTYVQVENEDYIPTVGEAICKPGDLWQLGPHKLLCGDSTNLSDVEKLMEKERAEITFTSPPYNLGNNAQLRAAGNESAYLEKSDHKDQSEYLDFLCEWTANALAYSTHVFCNIQCLAGNKSIFPEYWFKFKNNLVDVMIWDKENAQPAMAPRVLNSAFEFIFIFSMEDNPTRSIKTGADFRGTMSNIFRFNPAGKKEDIQKDHGAVFPVAFPEHFISTFTNEGAIVLDLFGGTGTTMIAAHKTGRQARLMEIDPRYCDIILERYKSISGNAPKLL